MSRKAAAITADPRVSVFVMAVFLVAAVCVVVVIVRGSMSWCYSVTDYMSVLEGASRWHSYILLQDA